MPLLQVKVSSCWFAFALLVWLVAAHTFPVTKQQALAESDDDPVVAVVNGMSIRRGTVREVVKGVIAASPEIPSSAEIDALTQDALDSVIDLELLYQEALARGIRVSNEAVEAEIEATEEQFADEDDFAAALYQAGLTEARLREETRKMLMVNRLLEQVVWAGIRIPDAAVVEFFERNRAALAGANGRHVRQILVRVPEAAAPKAREDALLKAKRLREQLIAGADFAEAAQQYSDDRNSAGRGGEIGPVDPNASDPLMKAAAQLRPGEVSNLVETREGYHIVQVVERQDKPLPPLDEAMRTRIVRLLTEKERRRRRSDFIAQLRGRAQITFIAPTLPPATEVQETPSPAALPTEEELP